MSIIETVGRYGQLHAEARERAALGTHAITPTDSRACAFCAQCRCPAELSGPGMVCIACQGQIRQQLDVHPRGLDRAVILVASALTVVVLVVVGLRALGVLP